MKKNRLVYAIMLAAALAIALYLACLNKPPYVSDYTECVNAGYAVMESYPRQCRTPDGKTYTEDMPALEPETGCREDAGCMLVNRARGFSCCWSGACEEIDYSLDGWIAVNRTWFEEGREKVCPSRQDCSPAPLCPTRIINAGYTANCSGNECVKFSVECVDSCGDGSCQDDAEDHGNLCLETNLTCPVDCMEKTGDGVSEIDRPPADEPEAVNKRTSRIDYSCQSDLDCGIKDVGSLCGEYLQCVNTNFEPDPPEIESSVCGYPEIDGCRCVNKRCLGEYNGELSVN
ncbi:MAG: hypothetical protein JW724_03815 [Candidatus Altiarchaeota archaeon]|nr:hypothetical protein [Candidatus Altiarchaeota archaeon]